MAGLGFIAEAPKDFDVRPVDSCSGASLSRCAWPDLTWPKREVGHLLLFMKLCFCVCVPPHLHDAVVNAMF